MDLVIKIMSHRCYLVSLILYGNSIYETRCQDLLMSRLFQKKIWKFFLTTPYYDDIKIYTVLIIFFTLPSSSLFFPTFLPT